MQWALIETAPRDGTILLGYDPGWYDMATPMVFDQMRMKFVFFHNGEEIHATHWMPMPKGPTAGPAPGK